MGTASVFLLAVNGDYSDSQPIRVLTVITYAFATLTLLSFLRQIALILNCDDVARAFRKVQIGSVVIASGFILIPIIFSSAGRSTLDASFDVVLPNMVLSVASVYTAQLLIRSVLLLKSASGPESE